MLVTPRPGVDRTNLLETLRSVQTQVSNLRGGGRDAFDRLLDYLNWASDAVATLGNRISSADLDRLVLTKRYEQLLSGVGALANAETTRLVNTLVSLELTQRTDAFNEAISTLNQYIERWSRPDHFIVADSSFYIHHPDKLADIDFAEVVNFYDGSIHLLVPMVVIDELDGLKQGKVNSHVRWRAGYTLAVLDKLFQKGVTVANLQIADQEVQRTTGVRRGEVNVEILFDPPRHIRLPINDDEIVETAATAQPLTGRQVTLITYDTGQASRARRAQLKVIKLNQQPEKESS